MDKFDSLSVVSCVRAADEFIRAYNGMTFMYDPDWTPDGGSGTLPVSFFHVRRKKELMESEITTSTMLFYDEGGVGASHGAVTSVVADNIVTKPKRWMLSVIIPCSSVNPLAQVSAPDVGDLMTAYSAGSSAAEAWATAGMITKSLSMTLDLVIKALYGVDTIKRLGVSGIRDILTVPEHNKTALEAMWRHRGLVRLKLANSWRYETVAVTGLDVVKEGVMGDNYEADITVQEVPIITYTSEMRVREPAASEMLSTAGTAAIKALDWLEADA